MMKYRFLSLVCALGAAALLSGCPGLVPNGFLLFVHNESEDTPITAIQFRAEGDEEFGPDQLDGDLEPGDSLDFVLDAPFRFQDEEGSSYDVRVTYDGLLVEVSNTSTFSCLHAGERTDWNWTPGDEFDRCVD